MLGMALESFVDPSRQSNNILQRSTYLTQLKKRLLHMTWFTMHEIQVPWLVYGLLPNDSSSAFVGKPEAGKSTAIRNLAASIIKSKPFLGREVFVPEGAGKVLYVHLDRKDPIEDVASELRTLGINET